MQQSMTREKALHVVGYDEMEGIKEVAAMPIEMLPEPRVPSALESQVGRIVKIVLDGYERNVLRFGLVDALEPIPAKERFTSAEFVAVDELMDDESASFITSLDCEDDDEDDVRVRVSDYPVPPISSLDLQLAILMLEPPETSKEEIARLLAG